MTVGSSRVYGHKRVIELIRELMRREEPDGSLRSQRFPILVIEGFRGAGKTALLATLADLLDQRVPYARLDFQCNSRASVTQVLSALAFDLSRKCPGYGALRFPRFIVGQLVMELHLDLTDHTQARQQIVDALNRQRGVDTVRKVLVDAAGSVLETMVRSVGVAVVAPTRSLDVITRWLTKLATRFAPGQRIVLGAFQNWYGHRDLGLPHDSIDVLVDLNRWATDADDEGNRRRIDELLWAAFLADLRAEFSRGRRADERALNCAVLLDNADTELARRFLHQLVRARRQRAVSERDDADPMTVVVTSRGALLSDVPGIDQALVTPDTSRAGPLPSTPDWSHCWWLQYQLPDLTEDEVGRAVTDMALAWADNQRLTRVVYDFTEGHPAATQLLLDTIARSHPQKWIEPEAILCQAWRDATSQHPVTLEDQMLSQLLGDISTTVFRDLVTCAAAREREQSLVLAGQGDMLFRGQIDYGEVLDPILWPADGSAGPALLRRLLRRCLAQRDPAITPTWPTVYGRLRRHCRSRGDEAGELFYALADGDLRLVTRRLHERLAELDSATWTELLLSVVQAPHQQRRLEAPIDEVRTLVAAAELDDATVAVGRLVTALQVATDPFTDSRRRHLHWQIAADYAEVSRLCPGGPHAVFLEAERRHRREAEWWD